MSKVFEFRHPHDTIFNSLLIPDLNIIFRSQQNKSTGTKRNIQVDEKEKETEDNELLCSKCNQLITSSSCKIEVSGSHSHFLKNPAGDSFNLRCFSEAKGCKIKGVPISDFSWFPGYKWTFAFCSNCSIQSGWFYMSPNDNFFGLMQDAIIGEY